jgi:hypothetical protein
MGAGRRSLLFLAVSLLLVWASQGAAGPAPELKSVRILGRYEIPGHPGGSALTDVRWAGDRSVYVLRALHGVEELDLGEEREPKSLRLPVPDSRELGDLRWMAHLAVSSQKIVVAPPNWRLAWRPREPSPGLVLFKGSGIGITDDLDVVGNRVLLLGAPSPEEPYTTGGVAWLGIFGSEPRDWKVLLQAPDAPNATALFHCSGMGLGAARFLPDRSFVVVPGFQPGAYLYDQSGRLSRAWTSQEIGLDTDCSKVSKQLGQELHVNLDAYRSWINRHQVLDDILPLPQGPGLLIRSFGPDRKVHWTLKVLHRQGDIQTYQVPLSGKQPFDRLRADVRNGRIVLLLTTGFVQSRDLRDYAGELILAEVPGS